MCRYDCSIHKMLFIFSTFRFHCQCFKYFIFCIGQCPKYRPLTPLLAEKVNLGNEISTEERSVGEISILAVFYPYSGQKMHQTESYMVIKINAARFGHIHNLY